MEEISDKRASNIFAGVVVVCLENLTDDELAQFVRAISWGDGNQKNRCKGWPWYDKIEHLFSGDNLHEETENAIHAVAVRRLEREESRK